jgi:hypothetical protein
MAVRKIMKSLEMEGFNNDAIQEFCFAFLVTKAQDAEQVFCVKLLETIECEFLVFSSVEANS